jgi:hypothetical protein
VTADPRDRLAEIISCDLIPNTGPGECEQVIARHPSHASGGCAAVRRSHQFAQETPDVVVGERREKRLAGRPPRIRSDRMRRLHLHRPTYGVRDWADVKARVKRHRRLHLGVQILPEHVKADGNPKRRFSTPAKAMEFAAESRFGHTSYRCSFCGSWHLA